MSSQHETRLYIEITWDSQVIRIPIHTTARIKMYYDFFKGVYGPENVRTCVAYGHLNRDLEESRIGATLMEQATNAIEEFEKEQIKQQTEKFSHLFGKPKRK